MICNDLSTYSRFFQRLERRYVDFLSFLPAGEPQRPAMQTTFDALLAHGLDTSAALRVLRQLVMHRLISLDCDHQAALVVVTRAVTELAELTLEIALQTACQELDARHGAPLADSSQERAQLWVIGMGKLGARELNVSSDIDLIYVYDQDGDTAGNAEGRNRISNHEYFAKAVKIIYDLIGAVTEHGFVFRVDLMLRPNGNSGPAAVSLAALEEYLQVQGREWERFAWMKSRVVAPLTCIARGQTDGKSGSASSLRSVVLPFVFRKYLDYNVFDALRNLHRQIRQESNRRSAGRPERANDVKLSRGGIREIEFTVQLLQVVRGGQFPELRKRPTLEALLCVARAGLMPQATAEALRDAYTFLRRVEHRIQYLDDQQTHVLPTQDADLHWIAQTMGYANCCLFLSDLDQHRELVANEFDTLLGGAEADKSECKGCKGGKTGAPSAAGNGSGNVTATDLQEVIAQLPVEFGKRIAAWAEQPRVQGLRDDAKTRLIRLVQRTGTWLREGRVTEQAALRSADFMEPLLRRESYLALLWERPTVHQRLYMLQFSQKPPHE